MKFNLIASEQAVVNPGGRKNGRKGFLMNNDRISLLYIFHYPIFQTLADGIVYWLNRF